jgi:hypothetical protein
MYGLQIPQPRRKDLAALSDDEWRREWPGNRRGPGGFAAFERRGNLSPVHVAVRETRECRCRLVEGS